MNFEIHFTTQSFLDLNELGLSVSSALWHWWFCGSSQVVLVSAPSSPPHPPTLLPALYQAIRSFPFLCYSPLSSLLISQSLHIFSFHFPFPVYQCLYFLPYLCEFLCPFSCPSPHIPAFSVALFCWLFLALCMVSVPFLPKIPRCTSLSYGRLSHPEGVKMPRILGWLLEGWNWALSCWKMLANASNLFNVNEQLQRSWICSSTNYGSEN